MPLQIYLDSSDFSVLSLANLTSRHREILGFLLGARAAGQIVLRFSAAHVMEGAATAPEYLSHSAARFATIARLCGTHCLVDPFAVMRDELSGRRSWSSGRPFREDGLWLPQMHTLDFQLPSVVEACRDAIRGSEFNRQQRRVLEAQLIDRQGRPTQKALALFEANGAPQLIRDMSAKFPMSERAIAITLDVVAGRRSRQDLMNELKESFAKLEAFHDWHSKRWDEISPLLSWLRKRGEDLAQKISDLRMQLETAAVRARSAGITDSELGNMADKELTRQEATFRRRIASGFVEEAVTLSVERAPGFTTFTQLAYALLRASATGTRNIRAPRRSDLGDILHAVYVPYVDIFRGDAYTGTALRPLLRPGFARIVSNLDELPLAIEEELAKRG